MATVGEIIKKIPLKCIVTIYGEDCLRLTSFRCENGQSYSNYEFNLCKDNEVVGRIEKCFDYDILNVKLHINETYSTWRKRLDTVCHSGIRKFYNNVERKDKVIFNQPATILYKDGKKYVSKCESNERFDEEKGLIMCLLKSHGYTYGDIERLLKGAKRYGKSAGEIFDKDEICDLEFEFAKKKAKVNAILFGDKVD